MKYGFLFFLFAIAIGASAARSGPWAWLLFHPAFAAAMMIVSGEAQTAQDAIAMIQAVRPGVELNKTQRMMLEQL